jgi:hypothetical protein
MKFSILIFFHTRILLFPSFNYLINVKHWGIHIYPVLPAIRDSRRLESGCCHSIIPISNSLASADALISCKHWGIQIYPVLPDIRDLKTQRVFVDVLYPMPISNSFVSLKWLKPFKH